MKMRATAGALLALCMATHALAAGDRIADPPRLKPNASDVEQKAWANRYLDQDGWMFVGNGSNTIWFAPAEAAAENDYPHVKDWIRVEDAGTPNAKAKLPSTLTLMEVDCARNLAHSIRAIAYSHNNLRGAIILDLDPGEPMQAMAPGSLGDMTVKAICRSAAASAEPK